MADCILDDDGQSINPIIWSFVIFPKINAPAPAAAAFKASSSLALFFFITMSSSPLNL
jgi:hypothetical protein